MQVLHQPGDERRLGDWLKESLDADWSQFRAAVAFVKRSGVKHISDRLAAFAKTAHVEIIVGVDHQGTSHEGLEALLAAVSSNGRIVVYHNRLPHTFHPKLYLFKSAHHAEVAIGSGNLTEGGLFTNYEVSALLRLDLSDPTDVRRLQTVERMLDRWSTAPNLALDLDDQLLARLMEWQLVSTEARASSLRHGSSTTTERDPPFASAGVRAAPAVDRRSGAARPASPPTAAPAPGIASSANCFVMTLQQTDVGVGQASDGTSKRSPEIFIPLVARNAHPSFWFWPDDFTEDPAKPGKFDRQATIQLAGTSVRVNMMTWPDRRDFRLRSGPLRSAGEIGDILRIEKVAPGLRFDYYVEIIPPGTIAHDHHLRLCTETVRNSKKRYGYF